MDDLPTTDDYETMLEAYLHTIDNKPHHALFERPAMLTLLPPLTGLRTLDAGCGAGYYARLMADAGAQVSALDINPEMVDLTARRLEGRGDARVGDLNDPLPYESSTFDLIVCGLVMHYLSDWERLFGEFARVLKPGGQFVFSTHHPFMDYSAYGSEDYFSTHVIRDENPERTITFYRRPLSATTEALYGAGFVIERVLEPKPLEAFREVDPKGYEYLLKQPGFLLVRGTKTWIQRHNQAGVAIIQS